MPTTPVLLLPYPAATDPADVPADIQKLANRLDIVVPVAAGARVFHSANQPIPSGVLTPLLFNSERFDNDTMHDPAGDSSRIICKTAGIYTLSVTVEFAGATGGVFRAVQLAVNGVAVASQNQPPNAANAVDITLATIFQLAVNDYVQVAIYHDRGSALDIVRTANFTPEFSAVRVGS
jgi:hypothetical protein